MSDLVELWEKPTAKEIHMIVGWRQWADAGSISSLLPEYLIEQTNAQKIGEIKAKGFYLFQIPGTHHLLRPEIQLDEGYPKGLTSKKNEIFYTGNDEKGLLIFLGDEPHLNADEYGEALFYIVQELGVDRVAAVGGVYGPMPYDRDRQISCSYSLKRMKLELEEYAVRFSNYEGGATIGSYLLKQAEKKDIEFFVFYAFVPAYDLTELSSLLQGMRIENDYKAWYDLMRRLGHMFRLEIDLTSLEQQSLELTETMETKVAELERKMPQLEIRQYMDKLAKDFTEMTFMPLDEVWERELGDLLDDIED